MKPAMSGHLYKGNELTYPTSTPSLTRVAACLSSAPCIASLSSVLLGCHKHCSLSAESLPHRTILVPNGSVQTSVITLLQFSLSRLEVSQTVTLLSSPSSFPTTKMQVSVRC